MRSPNLYPRRARHEILEALRSARVLLLMGARQVGKSTLAAGLVANEFPAASVNLDDRIPREAALADPEGFLEALGAPALIDEVQRGGPDLLLAIKAAVDRDQRPGRYLLTGSANLLTSRRTPDTLAGRLETVTLWPLAQCEIEASGGNLVDALFDAAPPDVVAAPPGPGPVVDRIARGGYPAVVGLPPARRERWYRSYTEAVANRDLTDLSDATRLSEVPGLLRLLAARAATPLVYREVGRRLAMDSKTVKAYVKLLEMAFVVRVVPGWRPSLASREGATPKVFVVDSGLLASLLGADRERLAEDDRVSGRCLENFVAMEVLRHAEWARTPTNLYHYRVGDQEVDLILESWAGDVACVEVKSTVSLSRRDWRPMAQVRDRLGDRFVSGFVIHPGRETQPIGDRLWAVPIEGLWRP
ncbi:MAG: ATP-binding protein [Solirubrobacterales bacterium]